MIIKSSTNDTNNTSFVSLVGVVRRKHFYTSIGGTRHVYFTIGFTHRKYCFGELPIECHAVGEPVIDVALLSDGREIEVIGKIVSVKSVWKDGTERPMQQIFVSQINTLPIHEANLKEVKVNIQIKFYERVEDSRTETLAFLQATQGNKKITAVGTTIRHPKDTHNPKIGQKVSLTRALNGVNKKIRKQVWQHYLKNWGA